MQNKEGSDLPLCVTISKVTLFAPTRRRVMISLGVI
jgi:hypothetical protein